MSAVEKLTLLEESLNRMTGTFADALRLAVADFNREPISVSSVDALRARVLAIADRLAEPMTDVRDGVYGGDALLGQTVGAFPNVARLDRAMGVRNQRVADRRLK